MAKSITTTRRSLPQIPPIFFSSFTKSPSVPFSPRSSQSPNLNLENTEKLYTSVQSIDLLSSLTILYTMAISPAVDLGFAILRSRTLMQNHFLRESVMGAVRRILYPRFCAGENAEEAGRTLGRLWEIGLRGIINYGMEDADDGSLCDRNLVGFFRALEMMEEMPQGSVSFSCVKITAICPVHLLERVSDLLRWENKHPSFHLPWKQPSLPILTNSSPLSYTLTPPPPLTSEEELELELSHSRLRNISKRCADANLPLLVDAEYASVQPAIDYMTYSMAIEFNTNGKKQRPIVYGTIQCYLKDAKERLVQAVDAAERAGISIGFKLVRGAYLSRERNLASFVGVESPIHENIQETHNCYNDCATFMLQRMVKGWAWVVLATHNLESGMVAAAKAEELGIKKTDQKLQFAQLMGMADGLSLGLRNAGFQVSKYLAFGPVHQVIPYLLRRVEENRGFISTSTLDRYLIKKELKRRLRVSIMGK